MNEVIFMKLFGVVMVSVLLMASILVITAPLADDQDLALKHHCEMVQIYRDSGGEYGWPDYNNTAHLCTEEQP